MRRLLLLLLVGLLAACGVPVDDGPRSLDRGAAPFSVFEPDVEPTQGGDISAELWFVSGDVLAPVQRAVPSPGSAQQVLELLFAGLTETERTGGLRNAIPAGLTFDNVAVQDGIATVTLAGLEEQVLAQVQVLAFAQIVITLDSRDDVARVRFRANDRDLPVPRGDGLLTEEPVDRDDYDEQLTPPPTTAAEVVPPSPVPS